jgi:transposase-like protein
MVTPAAGTLQYGAHVHLRCPFCEAYEVERLYLASLDLDSCVCGSCGARWDEEASTGDYRGRASEETVVAPREHRKPTAR